MPTHAQTPPPPLGEPESKKIGFVAPLFASSEISKTALHKLFSQGNYGTQFCLFVLANQMQASKTQIFGCVWHLLLFSNAFFNAQIWQKLEKYISSTLAA